jgi:hypothetical protein
MRGGEGALHCYRAGTGSSNAQVCTGETETRTCHGREKGYEVFADAGQTEEVEKVNGNVYTYKGQFDDFSLYTFIMGYYSEKQIWFLPLPLDTK